jgi:aminoglycoside 3-N-acetyltransferase I
MMNFQIKKLAPDEIEPAKELILLFGFDDEKSSLSSDEYIAEMLARIDFHVVIALKDGKLIGGLTAYGMKMFKSEKTEMFLYEIEVAEAYRRNGIGKALIEFLKKICEEKSIAEMFVGTEKDNTAARNLYSSTGGVADEDSVWFNYSD